ncbi:hypothetical protein HanXRQr2_Chr10g0420151 [Helianthus annuus]|uniref:Uncharacterized protein n=1 Tax=Helianthus annuus TaxID=4232 RepID=A0A9K3N2K4_HELAN|nr:hypothetical protein HanXRQr2_Chr10g0420151 [Helianthus annuus]KAJ0882132.1 hypothetical protein HanPSC8_Chr10g0406161 [Helianthus annuus]
MVKRVKRAVPKFYHPWPVPPFFTSRDEVILTVQELPYMQYPAATIFFPG